MKKLVFAFLVVFIFMGCATTNNSLQDKNRYFEESGGYSIFLPEGWQAAEIGLKYKALFGQIENSFQKNITFVDEAFDGDLDYYVNAVIEQLNTLFGENIKFLQQNDFVTVKKIMGKKIVTESLQYDRHIRQTLYIFPGNAKKILMTCTVLAEEGEAFDSFFDKVIETFEWVK